VSAPAAPNDRVYVASSPIHGLGLFAARALRAGQLVGVYSGPRVDTDGPHVLWIEDEPGGDWTGYEGRNEMRYLNHSARPNAEMDGLHCHPLPDIPPGAEITIDYGRNDGD